MNGMLAVLRRGLSSEPPSATPQYCDGANGEREEGGREGLEPSRVALTGRVLGAV